MEQVSPLQTSGQMQTPSCGFPPLEHTSGSLVVEMVIGDVAVVSVIGAVESVTGAVVSVTGAVVSVIGAVVSVTGAVVSVTGAVVSVTGAVVSVTGAVVSVTGAVVSVMGAVGSVMGDVAVEVGMVDEDVGSVMGDVVEGVSGLVFVVRPSRNRVEFRERQEKPQHHCPYHTFKLVKQTPSVDICTGTIDE